MHISKWNKLVWKVCIVCNSKDITFWKRQNCGVGKKISGASVWRGEGKRHIEEAFPGQWKCSAQCHYDGYVLL